MSQYFDKKYGGAAVSFSGVLMLIFSLLFHYQLSQNMIQSDYGDIAVALNISVILIALVQFGVPGYWLRYFAQWGYQGYTILFPSRKLIFLTSTIPILLATVSLLYFSKIDLTQRISFSLIMLIVPITAATEIGLVSLQLEGRFILFSYLRIIVSFLRCLSVFFLLVILNSSLLVMDSAICIFIASLIGLLILTPQL